MVLQFLVSLHNITHARGAILNELRILQYMISLSKYHFAHAKDMDIGIETEEKAPLYT